MNFKTLMFLSPYELSPDHRMLAGWPLAFDWMPEMVLFVDSNYVSMRNMICETIPKLNSTQLSLNPVCMDVVYIGHLAT